jgi:hypothetical protein
MLDSDIYIYSNYGAHHWRWMLHSKTLAPLPTSTTDRAIYFHHQHQTHYNVVLSVFGTLHNPAVGEKHRMSTKRKADSERKQRERSSSTYREAKNIRQKS